MPPYSTLCGVTDGQPFLREVVGSRAWRGDFDAKRGVSLVESRKGAVARCSVLRFPSPLIKPDRRISRILCGAPHKMRNVVAVVMWRWAQKAPSQGRELIFERHITRLL